MKLIKIALVWIVTAVPVWADGIEDAAPEAVVEAWISTVVTGNEQDVGAILAPEFQLVRGSGNAYTAKEYIAKGLPKITKVLRVSEHHATTGDSVMVVRYWLNIEETVDGQLLQKKAPRLTVFRKIEGRWYVSAHANFAVPQG